MPFSACPVCEGQLSTSALSCPHCGHPVWAMKLASLRRPFVNRMKATKSVSAFCIAAILLSVFVWFSDSTSNMFALAPFGSESEGPLPITLLTYALAHTSPSVLLWNLLPLLICGLILEPQVGSLRMLFTILGGILVPGLLWMCFAGGDELLIMGSSGIFFGMVGGFLALWHRYWSSLLLTERILIGMILVFGCIGVISVLVAPWSPWTPIVAIPVGYAIALTLGPLLKTHKKIS